MPNGQSSHEGMPLAEAISMLKGIGMCLELMAANKHNGDYYAITEDELNGLCIIHNYALRILEYHATKEIDHV